MPMTRSCAVWVMLVAALAAGVSAAQPPTPRQKPDPTEAARERMVRDDISAGGVADERVLAAMRATPRHEFVPGPQRSMAYFDMALPIGEAQTISGPFVVAYMTEKLEPKPTDKVLEIGTGSGYQAAVLAPLVRTVYSIEIHDKLGEKAAKTLARLGYKNVVTKIGDGFRGWPEHAPFDKIIVTCSPEDVPRPLVEQLAEGGRMVIPVGERYDQTLVLLTKREGRLEREALVPSLFVPMTGTAEQGRRVQPDGARPAIDNGGFETLLPESSVPTAWYYPRQMTVVEADDAPEGRRYLQLDNADPGRPAQVFQGFPVDGRQVSRLAIAGRVRAEAVRPGIEPDELPAFVVKFFDESRARSARSVVGQWSGTFPWKDVSGTVPVPTWAREAILQVGLLGATGRVEIDAVVVSGIAR